MHIDNYRNKRGNEQLDRGLFWSLSCNKTNPYEFAVGTNYNAKSFDFRKMKPRYEFHHCLNRIRDPDREHQFHVSWSTNGKYIFTKDEALFDKNEELYFFWDVDNAERIIMANDSRSLVIPSVYPDTWIDDHLIVSSEHHGVHAISPFLESKQIEEPQNTGRGWQYNMGGYPRFMAYNEKTLQLAGGDWQKIYIYSHFKLPPYSDMICI